VGTSTAPRAALFQQTNNGVKLPIIEPVKIEIRTGSVRSAFSRLSSGRPPIHPIEQKRCHAQVAIDRLLRKRSQYRATRLQRHCLLEQQLHVVRRIPWLFREQRFLPNRTEPQR
jgi:hypothetical protein